MRTLLAAALAAGLTVLPTLPAQAAVATGDEAPAFTLTDSKGEAHSLSDFKDKYVVLEWVNFGCPFVKKHYNSGNMPKLQKDLTDRGVVWLTICSSGPGKQGYAEPDAINKTLGEKKAAQTAYLIDGGGKVGRAYGAKATPHMFVVDPAGKVIYQGAIDSIPSADTDDIPKATNYVVESLDASMKGKAVPNGTTKPYGCSVKYGS